MFKIILICLLCHSLTLAYGPVPSGGSSHSDGPQGGCCDPNHSGAGHAGAPTHSSSSAGGHGGVGHAGAPVHSSSAGGNGGSVGSKRPYWWEGANNPFKECTPGTAGCLDGSHSPSKNNQVNQPLPVGQGRPFSVGQNGCTPGTPGCVSSGATQLEGCQPGLAGCESYPEDQGTDIVIDLVEEENPAPIQFPSRPRKPHSTSSHQSSSSLAGSQNYGQQQGFANSGRPSVHQTNKQPSAQPGFGIQQPHSGSLNAGRPGQISHSPNRLSSANQNDYSPVGNGDTPFSSVNVGRRPIQSGNLPPRRTSNFPSSSVGISSSPALNNQNYDTGSDGVIDITLEESHSPQGGFDSNRRQDQYSTPQQPGLSNPSFQRPITGNGRPTIENPNLPPANFGSGVPLSSAPGSPQRRPPQNFAPVNFGQNQGPSRIPPRPHNTPLGRPSGSPQGFPAGQPNTYGSNQPSTGLFNGNNPQISPSGPGRRPTSGSYNNAGSPQISSVNQPHSQGIPTDNFGIQANPGFDNRPVEGLPFKQNEINPQDLRPIATGIALNGMPMMMMPSGMNLIGGSCSAGSFCVPLNTCNPYTGFIIRDINRIAAARPNQPQVPLIECFIPAGVLSEGVCCQEEHPLAGSGLD